MGSGGLESAGVFYRLTYVSPEMLWVVLLRELRRFSRG